MKLSEIVEIIDGKLYNAEIFFDWEIKGVAAADLMSDVLANAQPDTILLTGLCNLQVIRTAQMADVRAIVCVRGKRPSKEMVELASQEEIPLISSPFGMFETCGRLYQAGLPGLQINIH